MDPNTSDIEESSDKKIGAENRRGAALICDAPPETESSKDQKRLTKDIVEAATE